MKVENSYTVSQQGVSTILVSTVEALSSLRGLSFVHED